MAIRYPLESDLHSMAYSSSLHNPYPSLGWDLHDLGVLNADMSLVMKTTAQFFSPSDSDLSTGYLQDALVECSDRSKRRRLLFYTNDQTTGLNDPFKDYWNSNCTADLPPSQEFNCLSQITNADGISVLFPIVDEPLNTSMNSVSEEAAMASEIKTLEGAVSAPETLNSSSSSSSYKDSVQIKCRSSSEGHRRRKYKVITRVVYPFTVVKPGGVEGDITLNDINKRILMPPTRPVRHPVGDFACRPCVSPDGPGLSGKAVVALTRIHTQGSGTITIIRTKG
ncbi:hypothetical protein HHK36_024169 [Tetracentron sinense]|uniref:Protein XRI1 n=1 Tax=Tetracentron sinense TaxID=13715 RepID=A0A834YKI8_TETSI|nr:hypothetical protein HHK36_024169 [Tetracentron sinense]